MTVSTSRCSVPLLLASLLFSSAVAATCFFPNGTQQNAGAQADQGIIYKPCNPDAKASMCCAPWDTCTPDGLCQSANDGNTWRDSCTDPTWKSPSCVKLCVSGFDQAIIEAQTDLNMADNDVTVTQCSDRSYCCGNGTAAVQCCDNHLGVWIDPLTGQGTNKNPGEAVSSISTSTVSHTTQASYVTPISVAGTTESSQPVTSALPLPATGLSSYSFSTPVSSASSSSSIPSANSSTPTGNNSVAAPSTSIATFKANSGAPVIHASLPVVGSVLVASLFSLAM